ncbi:MAG: ATP synthase subunit C [Gammaproteobacteria bacterium]
MSSPLKRRSKIAAVLTAAAGVLSLAATVLVFATAHAAEPAAGAGAAASAGSLAASQWGYIAAALATGMSSLGAGYAVGVVGSAAVGALAEKPELLGRVLILVGLAEGIAIYGLIISILILNRL